MDNYDAWNIDTTSLDTPRDLLRLAVLAPSSHNSQPWRFTVEDNLIRLSLDPARRLKKSDSNDRQAIISIGCAMEHILIGAEYYGYEVQVTNYNENKDATASIRLTKKREQMNDPHHIIHAIPKRMTNRTPYTDTVPSAEIIQKINTLTQPSLSITVITDKEKVALLGDIAVNAGIAAMQDTDFRNELSHYLKPNTTKSPVGMPGFGFGFPALLSYIAPLLVRFVNMAKLSKKADRALFAHTPALIVISTEHDTPTDWFLVGRTYARIALIATQAGMSTAPWGAPIQIGEYYRDIQKILDVSSRPQFFCRFGYPTASTHHTPRIAFTNVQ
jgi:hypothetical protein